MRKFKLIMTIVFAVLLTGDLLLSLGIHVALNHTDLIGNYSEENTQECKATVSSVQIIPSDGAYSIRIYTKEYSAFLQIASIEEPKEINEALLNGAKISFRVPNSMHALMTTGQFVEIVSLETDEKVLLSIWEYNNHIRSGINQSLRALYIKACVEFVVLASCALSIIFGKKKTRDSSPS